ncbi:MAG: hypothetical protein ABH834_07945 [Candidatus Altiarchaeota archaeon]
MIKHFLAFIIACLFLSANSAALQVSGLDVAVKTIPFLETMPEKDGLIVYSKHCENKECTPLTQAYPQSRAWVVLAYTQLYEATGDQQYLTKAEDAMEKLLINCPPDSGADCQYIGVQAEKLYTLTSDERYLEYLKGLDEKLIPRGGGDDMLKAIAARELALAYKHGIYNKPVQLVGALKMLTLDIDGGDTLLEYEGIELKRHSCWSQLAWIEFYKALDARDDDEVVLSGMTVAKIKPQVLKQPETFFKTINFETLSSTPNIYVLTLTELEPCAEGLIDMYEITGDEDYRNRALAFLNGLLDRHWDAEYSVKYVGDNSFTAQGCRASNEGEHTCYRNNKILTDNAYATYLYARVKDEKFTVNEKEIVYLEEPILDPDLIPEIAHLPKTTTSTKPTVTEQTKAKTPYLSLIALLAVVLAAAYVISQKNH